MAPARPPPPAQVPGHRPRSAPEPGRAMWHHHPEREAGSGLGRVQEQAAGGKAAKLTLRKPHVLGEAATRLP